MFKNNNAWSKDSATAPPHWEWNKQLSRPPTLMISQANCLLCVPSGGNNCAFFLIWLTSSLTYLKISSGQLPNAWLSCLNWVSLKQRGSILQRLDGKGCDVTLNHRSLGNRDWGSICARLTFFLNMKKKSNKIVPCTLCIDPSGLQYPSTKCSLRKWRNYIEK